MSVSCSSGLNRASAASYRSIASAPIAPVLGAGRDNRGDRLVWPRTVVAGAANGERVQEADAVLAQVDRVVRFRLTSLD